MIDRHSLQCAIFFAFLFTFSNAFSQLRCQAEDAVFSSRGDKPTQIIFRNNSINILRIFWIDYSGSRKWYANILPGEIHIQPTYASHPWVVTDRSGNCKMVTFAELGSNTIRIGNE